MRFSIFIFSLVFFAATSSFAEVKPWGLGIIINNPTGFSVKHRTSQENSIDAALGYSFGDGDYLTIHSTYLWEFNEGIPVKSKFIGYYFGVGGSFHSWDGDDPNDDRPDWVDNNDDEEVGLAVRGVGGLNYYFDEPSFEVFLEIALNFFFVPATEADFDLAIGGRFYF